MSKERKRRPPITPPAMAPAEVWWGFELELAVVVAVEVKVEVEAGKGLVISSGKLCQAMLGAFYLSWGFGCVVNILDYYIVCASSVLRAVDCGLWSQHLAAPSPVALAVSFVRGLKESLE